MKIGSRKVVLGALLVAVAMVVALFTTGVPRDSSEAAIITPGGITAAPSALPGIPYGIDQILPAIAPASGPGAMAVVGVYCDPDATGDCPDAEQGIADGHDYVTFTITRAWPEGSPAATFAANGMQTLKCEDGSSCDLAQFNPEAVFTEVDGGGVNEVIWVTGTDESGDSRRVNIIFVETVFAVSPLNSGTAISATIVSYRCPDVGAVVTTGEGDEGPAENLSDWEDWLEWMIGFGYEFDPLDGVAFYKCGGDTGSPVDDRVNFETDKGILTVEEPADIAVGIDWFTLNPTCDAGDSVDVLDSPGPDYITGGQTCDLDFAPNGVVSYGLMGTGDVGVATVTSQQSGGGGVARSINVTFAGIAALQLFIDAPAAVGTSGAEFTTIIVDQDGRPIPNETIECSVSPTGGALIIVPQTGTSDSAGEVTFTMVPTGASVIAGEELTINCHLDSNPDVKASDTVNLSGTPDLETVDLVEGCNPVASTWPDATAIADAAGAVAPAEALDAIWKFDPATSTWMGYSPSAPAAVSDLDSIDMLDAVFICVNAAATWSRPVI